MPVVTIYPGGSSGGFAGTGRVAGDDGAKRGEIKGWTQGAQRRLVAWLWSINPDALDRHDGWALTLTVGETPPSAAEWHALRRAFQARLKRHGVELQHWVVEWTAKKRPHMHMAVYGAGRIDIVALVAWLELCDKRDWPVNTRAQHITPITGVSGWLKYVSKHAARGVTHYQRQGAPDGWDKTGRLWGHSGEWPIDEPLKLDLERHEFHEYRRLVLTWQKKRMQREGVPAKVWHKLGRQYGDRDKGAMMGVSGWIPDTVSLMLLELAYQKEVRIDYRNWEF